MRIPAANCSVCWSRATSLRERTRQIGSERGAPSPPSHLRLEDHGHGFGPCWMVAERGGRIALRVPRHLDLGVWSARRAVGNICRSGNRFYKCRIVRVGNDHVEIENGSRFPQCCGCCDVGLRGHLGARDGNRSSQWHCYCGDPGSIVFADCRLGLLPSARLGAAAFRSGFRLPVTKFGVM